MVVYHSTKIISDYNHDIWNYQFFELFPHGLDEQCPIKLRLEAYMVDTLQLSLKWFSQHHEFPLITFDVFAHNRAITSIYVYYKVSHVDAMQTTIVSQKNLTFQLWIIILWPTLNS